MFSSSSSGCTQLGIDCGTGAAAGRSTCMMCRIKIMQSNPGAALMLACLSFVVWTGGWQALPCNIMWAEANHNYHTIESIALHLGPPQPIVSVPAVQAVPLRIRIGLPACTADHRHLYKVHLGNVNCSRWKYLPPALPAACEMDAPTAVSSSCCVYARRWACLRRHWMATAQQPDPLVAQRGIEDGQVARRSRRRVRLQQQLLRGAAAAGPLQGGQPRPAVRSAALGGHALLQRQALACAMHASRKCATHCNMCPSGKLHHREVRLAWMVPPNPWLRPNGSGTRLLADIHVIMVKT